jgi:ketosteroid isomerase-like protein
MSHENVEIVLRFYAAYNRHDVGAAVAHFHPDVEYHLAGGLDRPLDYHGRDEIRDLFLALWADWEEVFEEPRDPLDVGDRVLVRAVERRVGRDGIVLEATGGQLWELDDDGLITSFRAFDSWDDAAAAAGLSE